MIAKMIRNHAYYGEHCPRIADMCNELCYASREISERRNKLLREMYHMLRLRENVGSIFKMNEEDEEGLPSFLEKYDMNSE